MKPLSFEHFVSYMNETRQSFWATLSETEIDVHIYDQEGTEKMSIAFEFDLNNMDWTCIKLPEVKKFRSIYEDFQEVDIGYYDPITRQELVGNIKITLNTFLYLCTMHIVREDDDEMDLVLVYHPEISEDDLTITVSNSASKDQSVVNFHLQDHCVLMDDIATSEKRLFTFLKSTSSYLVQDATGIENAY